MKRWVSSLLKVCWAWVHSRRLILGFFVFLGLLLWLLPIEADVKSNYLPELVGMILTVLVVDALLELRRRDAATPARKRMADELTTIASRIDRTFNVVFDRSCFGEWHLERALEIAKGAQGGGVLARICGGYHRF